MALNDVLEQAAIAQAQSQRMILAGVTAADGRVESGYSFVDVEILHNRRKLIIKNCVYSAPDSSLAPYQFVKGEVVTVAVVNGDFRSGGVIVGIQVEVPFDVIEYENRDGLRIKHMDNGWTYFPLTVQGTKEGFRLPTEDGTLTLHHIPPEFEYTAAYLWHTDLLEETIYNNPLPAYNTITRIGSTIIKITEYVPFSNAALIPDEYLSDPSERNDRVVDIYKAIQHAKGSPPFLTSHPVLISHDGITVDGDPVTALPNAKQDAAYLAAVVFNVLADTKLSFEYEVGLTLYNNVFTDGEFVEANVDSAVSQWIPMGPAEPLGVNFAPTDKFQLSNTSMNVILSGRDTAEPLFTNGAEMSWTGGDLTADYVVVGRMRWSQLEITSYAYAIFGIGINPDTVILSQPPDVDFRAHTVTHLTTTS